MKKLLLVFAATLAFTLTGFAQSSNNDDEVVKIDEFSRYESVEGELIVKFADNTVLSLSLNDDRSLQATGIQAVDAVLSNYTIEKAIRLCPNDDPNRTLRTSKSYGGNDVVERDLSRLCLIKVAGTPDRCFSLMEELKQMDEVEFVEPNYIAYALGGYDRNHYNTCSALYA